MTRVVSGSEEAVVEEVVEVCRSIREAKLALFRGEGGVHWGEGVQRSYSHSGRSSKAVFILEKWASWLSANGNGLFY